MSGVNGPDDQDIRKRMSAEWVAMRTVAEWEAGAKALALLQGAARVGLLDALRSGATEIELANSTGIELTRVSDICAALYAHGALDSVAGGWKVSDSFAPLLMDDALRPLSGVATLAMAEARTIAILAAGRDPRPLSPEDVIAVATGVSVNPESPMRRGLIHIADPFVSAAFTSGRRHLELGCGIGGNLLSVLATFPNLTGVGIDLDKRLLEIAQGRAEVMGLADRLELRCTDAQQLTDEAAFDTAVWSDMFFELPSRESTLRAAFRALRPGGLLLVGGAAKFDSTGDPRSAQARATALSRLLRQGLGVPLTTDAEMQTDLTAAGFIIIGAVENPARRRLIVQRPG